MSYLDRFEGIAPADLTRRLPFICEGKVIGYVEMEFARQLQTFKDVFLVTPGSVEISKDLYTFEARTEAIDHVLRTLKDKGVLKNKWVDEAYRVGLSFSGPQFFNIERSAVSKFGIRAYGVHLNGFVKDGGQVKMWIGKRADDKPVAPGKLDQLVAGGQPANLTLRENLAKECAEEANIPPELAAKAKPVGAITYNTEAQGGLRRDVLFNFDLEVPADFTPVNTDGELQSFSLHPMEEVLQWVHDTDDFKFNCSIVILDFAIRHGLIEPDHPEYLDIIERLTA